MSKIDWSMRVDTVGSQPVEYPKEHRKVARGVWSIWRSEEGDELLGRPKGTRGILVCCGRLWWASDHFKGSPNLELRAKSAGPETETRQWTNIISKISVTLSILFSSSSRSLMRKTWKDWDIFLSTKLAKGPQLFNMTPYNPTFRTFSLSTPLTENLFIFKLYYFPDLA